MKMKGQYRSTNYKVSKYEILNNIVIQYDIPFSNSVYYNIMV